MGAVTYPNARVAEFVTGFMVPLQVMSDSQLANDFNIKWTPSILVLDFYGKEHQRTVGYFPPEEFIPSLLLGMGKVDFDTDYYNDAIVHFDRLLSEYPSSMAAPEAVYLRGVCRYKASHDAKPLKEAYEKLKAQYPESEWARRAEPYNLL